MGEAKRLLLVEDDAPLREALCKAVAREGVDVRATASAAEARRSAERERFDVVLSDVRVPGGGGMSVLACCRALQPGTPVILMTGFDEPGGRERALAGGAAAYLVKPIPLARLLEVLRRALASGG